MSRVRVAEPFVVIPLWLIERASPEALKLYATLYAHETFTNPRKTIPKSRLAERLGVSVRTVDKWVNDLVEAGAVEVESRAGSGTPNTYVLLAVSPERTTKETADPPGRNLPTPPAENVASYAGALPGSSEVEASEEPLPLSLDEAVELIWKSYPRQVGRDALRAALAKRVEGTKRYPKADLGEIVAGVARFAADPNLPGPEDEQFIPHPATWINQGRWTDGPLAPRRGRSAARAAGGVDQAAIARRLEAKRKLKEAG